MTCTVAFLPVRLLVGAVVLEQNDEWDMQRSRCMSLEAIAPLSNGLALKLSAAAA